MRPATCPPALVQAGPNFSLCRYRTGSLPRRSAYAGSRVSEAFSPARAAWPGSRRGGTGHRRRGRRLRLFRVRQGAGPAGRGRDLPAAHLQRDEAEDPGGLLARAQREGGAAAHRPQAVRRGLRRALRGRLGQRGSAGRTPAVPDEVLLRRRGRPGDRHALRRRLGMTGPTYSSVNRAGWNRLKEQGLFLTQAYGPDEFAHARTLLDPAGWLPWARIRTVLCLASGGGQQGPLFASLGCRVTVVDLSPEQLATDRAAARRYGLDLTCVEADMLDLSPLRGQTWDLVFQPVSSLYVPDVRQCYRQVAAVTRPGGLYFSE